MPCDWQLVPSRRCMVARVGGRAVDEISVRPSPVTSGFKNQDGTGQNVPLEASKWQFTNHGWRYGGLPLAINSLNYCNPGCISTPQMCYKYMAWLTTKIKLYKKKTRQIEIHSEACLCYCMSYFSFTCWGYISRSVWFCCFRLNESPRNVSSCEGQRIDSCV